MAEDPINLFATRAERYPQPTEADVVLGTARAALAAIPFVGGSITEVLSVVLAPAVTRRRDDWFKQLADALDQLESKVQGFKVESLAENDAFVSAVIQATRAATATHQQEKLEYLRNALLNVAIGNAPDELKQQIFLGAIEAFSPAHVKTLDLLWKGSNKLMLFQKNLGPFPGDNYGEAIGIAVPELKGQLALISAILTDLKNRGFQRLEVLGTPFTDQSGVMTDLGIEFLRFVLTPPENLSK